MSPKDRLWAPWRMQYVEHHGPDTSEGKTGCIFCDFPAEDNDTKNLIAHRGELAYVILNGFPYNNGHVMVVPYEHNAKLHEVSPETAQEITELTQLALKVLEGVYHPGGFNIGINQGDAAGAGIGAHLHQHIVPRWVGDTNFMPVVADVRVLPEALSGSYEKISAGFRAALSS
ncbi:MAG: HIT domain-containing protein [Thermoleophilaceae bacterium]|nr:HIT domain-containing protein [Thermoleophilaceae bacterium]